MKEQPLYKVKKKFTKIEVFETDKHLKFLLNRYIVIREKIDGSNLSIRRVGDKLIASSREYELTDTYTLSGAYQFVQNLDVNKFVEGFVYYGEWIVPYRLNYEKDNYTIRLFAVIYDNDDTFSTFVPLSLLKELILKTELPLAPSFYEGEFISEEHLLNFVGKTEMVQPVESNPNALMGEGIVFQVYDENGNPLKNGCNHLLFKLVNNDFKERKFKTKAESYDGDLYTFLDDVVTIPRIKKKYLDKVVEGFYPTKEMIKENPKDIRIIMQSLPTIIYNDILEEVGEELTVILDDLFEKESENTATELTKEKFDNRVKKRISKFITNRILKYVGGNEE